MKLVKFNIKNGQHILVNANSVTSIEKKIQTILRMFIVLVLIVPFSFWGVLMKLKRHWSREVK